MKRTKIEDTNTNRINQLVMPSLKEPHPGTPDSQVPRQRRAGRLAARRGAKDCPHTLCEGSANDRTQWWLGWYDVRLARFFVAAVLVACLFGKATAAGLAVATPQIDKADCRYVVNHPELGREKVVLDLSLSTRWVLISSNSEHRYWLGQSYHGSWYFLLHEYYARLQWNDPLMAWRKEPPSWIKDDEAARFFLMQNWSPEDKRVPEDIRQEMRKNLY